MKVLFAPDWRDCPYQRLLAEALGPHGVEVTFLNHYKRLLPLTRLVREHRADLLHLHWPEAYYPRLRDGRDFFRRARFRADLALASRHLPLVLTAHNLQEHNAGKLPFARANYAAAYRRARLIFAHSAAARDALVESYGLRAEKICVVPHGDLSVAMPPPVPPGEARARLGLPASPLCLMFGAVEPYKGQEEILAWWRETQPAAQLVIVGRPGTAEYGEALRKIAEGVPNVSLQFRWLSDAELALYLSAADCTVFNYLTVFTSGAASLAHSWGLPILIPSRLTTVDLHEPDPRVFRFAQVGSEFAQKLQAALQIAPDFTAAADWRGSIAWPRIAAQTVDAYRAVLETTSRREL
jgi:glycosyltransferase involved in cell wall biosynthesis